MAHLNSNGPILSVGLAWRFQRKKLVLARSPASSSSSRLEHEPAGGGRLAAARAFERERASERRGGSPAALSGRLAFLDFPRSTAGHGGAGAVRSPGGDVPGDVERPHLGEEAGPPPRVPGPRVRAQRQGRLLQRAPPRPPGA
jgi:hypothetical protein